MAQTAQKPDLRAGVGRQRPFRCQNLARSLQCRDKFSLHDVRQAAIVPHAVREVGLSGFCHFWELLKVLQRTSTRADIQKKRLAQFPGQYEILEGKIRTIQVHLARASVQSQLKMLWHRQPNQGCPSGHPGPTLSCRKRGAQELGKALHSMLKLPLFGPADALDCVADKEGLSVTRVLADRCIQAVNAGLQRRLGQMRQARKYPKGRILVPPELSCHLECVQRLL
mmetsp:Transcript_19567/g.47296  ORF Transcript_19567/g.47296 Transcript_19567/m.47296 type:complete len:225 (+) Transcript_19567:535-1209(+)